MPTYPGCKPHICIFSFHVSLFSNHFYQGNWTIYNNIFKIVKITMGMTDQGKTCKKLLPFSGFFEKKNLIYKVFFDIINKSKINYIDNVISYYKL